MRIRSDESERQIRSMHGGPPMSGTPCMASSESRQARACRGPRGWCCILPRHRIRKARKVGPLGRIGTKTDQLRQSWRIGPVGAGNLDFFDLDSGSVLKVVSSGQIEGIPLPKRIGADESFADRN